MGQGRLRSGDRVDGRYRVARELGDDESGELYAAILEGTDRRCVLQRLRPALAGHTDAVLRIARDLRELSALHHPAIAETLDVFRASEGEVYLIAEAVDGLTLAEALRHGPWAAKRVAGVVGQIASALAAAHAQGIVHGDLRPANVIVTRAPSGTEERVKLVGFGMARAASTVGLSANDSSSPSAYAAPEQSELPFEAIDERADEYALAALAYAMLTGEPPPRPPLPSRLSSLRLAKVIARGMEKDREQRYASVLDFHRALSDAASPNLAPPITVAPCVAPRAVVETPALAAVAASYTVSQAATETPEPRHPTIPMDENVQFSVYRPVAVAPGRWYPLLAFAHLSEPREGDGPSDPLAEVVRQVEQSLGEQFDRYQEARVDAASAVPREGQITFVPRVAGITFNPPSSSFLWVEPVHKVEFRLRAEPSSVGQVVRGALIVFLGSVILADVPLVVRVGAAEPALQAPGSLQVQSARPYRTIFASYSRNDEAIVVEFERYVETLGDRYLRDCRDLRAGELWSERLAKLIHGSSVFQLFWSKNASISRFVRMEWAYALRLARPYFVRPVYWEEPCPVTPPELERTHFQRIAFGGSARTQAFAERATGFGIAASQASAGPATLPRASLPPTRERRRRRLLPVGAFVLGNLLVALFLLRTHRGGSLPNVAPPQPAVGVPSFASDPPAPDWSHPKQRTGSVGHARRPGEGYVGGPGDDEPESEVSRGRLVIRSDPPFSRVCWRDSGEILGHTPLDLAAFRSPRGRLWVELDGYRGREVELTPALVARGSVRVSLRKLGARQHEAPRCDTRGFDLAPWPD